MRKGLSVWRQELFFRYAVEDLAERADYLEAVQLLSYGELPTPSEQRAFQGRVRAQRSLPPAAEHLLVLMALSRPRRFWLDRGVDGMS